MAWASLLVVVVHGMILLVSPASASPRTFIPLIAVPLASGLICLVRARRDGWEGWMGLAAAMVLWAGGMAAAGFGVVTMGVADVTNLSMLLYVLYGVPIIFTLASPVDEAWYVRLVDALLASVLGYLFFCHVSAKSTMSGAGLEEAIALRFVFDVENIYILAFAAIRLIGSAAWRERQFLRVLTSYAAAYALVAAYINHVHWESAYGRWPDLVIDLPFLILAFLASWPRSAPVREPSRLLTLVVRAGSPLMLPATLLTVSALLATHDAMLAVAGSFAATVGYGLRSALVQLRGYIEQDRLQQLSHNDALTGVANRRLFDDVLQREATRAHRDGTALTLLMIDIDHFKLLNDHLGHPVGDVRLQSVASALASCAKRGTDLVARYGGEEFAILLPGITQDLGYQLAERMRAAVEALQLSSPSPGGVVTVSVGLSHVTEGTSDTQAFVKSADEALYEAKRAGRNRVVTSCAQPTQEG